ncbi:DNA-binding transcriptional ArsR family regulator [Streptomyces candidus]|uniref:DNA-binding transcriptional ArsR family regulator n=1 Tax=Streptomyces candidus TaxID=67283 RepID=A0A7X0HM08_9ACTN|nr:DNA-binding transcriptional ArsR family regulator [Streptomyces candidus]GHH57663.1 hypothetical protein GCM10018773_65280 [Streptomyces candidus]
MRRKFSSEDAFTRAVCRGGEAGPADLCGAAFGTEELGGLECGVGDVDADDLVRGTDSPVDGFPMRARIAERLDQSGPTVSQTLARMERDGLVTAAGDRHLEFTEEGRRLASDSRTCRSAVLRRPPPGSGLRASLSAAQLPCPLP